MKIITCALVAAMLATPAHAETIVYPRHCTESDYSRPGMTCTKTGACEDRGRSVFVSENTEAQLQGASPKCTIQTRYKTNAPCVVDPAVNETTCGHEARMAVAKRHWFADMADANMTEAIHSSEKLDREDKKAYAACMAKHHFCEYRDGL
jgi:hypothetical protein